MAQQMMWIPFEEQYRGQATQGEVVTVAEDAMKLALKKAGNWVFDSDWWVETLIRVLEHWGIYRKRWLDPATQVVRLHFSVGNPTPDPNDSKTASGPLSTRILSGPLDRNKEGST